MSTNKAFDSPHPFLLALMAIASPIALNIYAPLMPMLADQFSVSNESVQFGFTLYLLSLALGQLIAGPLADRWGARPVLVYGFLIHIVGCLLVINSQGIAVLLIGRCLQAAGGCTGMLLARSLVLQNNNLDKSGALLAYITLGIASSQALAPTLGAYLAEWFGWRSAILLSFVIALVILLFAIRFLSKEQKTSDPVQNSKLLSNAAKNYWAVLRNRVFLTFALSNALITSSYIVFINNMPFIVEQELNGSATDFGNWFLWVAGGFWLGSFIAGRSAIQLGARRLIFFGYSLSVFAAFTMLFLLYLFMQQASYWLFFIPMAVFTIGRGLSQPNAQATAVKSCQHNIASSNAVFAAIQLLLSSLIGQLSSYWLHSSILNIAIIISGLAILAFALAVFNSRTHDIKTS
ncbi:MAG: multidrug effflux MFS transporter [Cellvibrionaceae bacterium]|nr:multidrug effflux MFS transporter [Cellvibrionaceae bacterium]